MQVEELKKRVSEYGGVERLLLNLNKKGIVMSRTSYFRKLKGKTEFTRKELLGMADELSLNDKDIYIIFFSKEVS